MTDPLDLFSPPVARWFRATFSAPTAAETEAWPRIASGRDVLLAAPTGSGKTLAAFLVVIDRIVRRALEGRLADEVAAVYVSPLRALSFDIQRNLEAPLAGIRAAAAELGMTLPEIRSAVRTGDTKSGDRAAMVRRPPHLVVTTPESLYLLLTAARTRRVLATTETVIVDEIHAMLRDKRGAHLALTLERLGEACRRRPQRIGLSATQRPIEALAAWLSGSYAVSPAVVDLGHQRELDLSVVAPPTPPLGPIATTERWKAIVERIAALVVQHRTTLVFVNTRRLAERLGHQLGEALQGELGGGVVSAHHGSLARERRLEIETALKEGRLRALVCTASLELGIDIGRIDLVVQIGSPRGIATFLQRVGRSGHALGLIPKGRLFPTTRDDLVEVAALVRAVRRGHLDGAAPRPAPLDILAQQLVAECAAAEPERRATPNDAQSAAPAPVAEALGPVEEEAFATTPLTEDHLFALVQRAAPYRDLPRSAFESVLELLHRGFETPRGRRGTHLFRDRRERTVRARRGARLAALTSGGAIPDLGDYRVLLEPEGVQIGTVHEDWAVESMVGDVFVLGSRNWRIRAITNGAVRVEDAHGVPPSIPFWLGEAPGRSDVLSEEVSGLREEIALRLESADDGLSDWLASECGLDADAAAALIDYVRAQLAAVGFVPTRRRLFAERFFDESGGQQLVIHSPFGIRVNRAFGLALRKRFCRTFDQELQAAAQDDALVLSLGQAQTFPLETLSGFLSSKTLVQVLEQALLGSPLFATRWRWNAGRALSIPRWNRGALVPFNVRRMQADDLLAAAFPDQTACQENVSYPIEIPDHPLVRQTIDDGLHEALDIDGLHRLVQGLESGSIRFEARDVVTATPFGEEILHAHPYAFLDDAPLEERRTRAVATGLSGQRPLQDLAALDPEVIRQVRADLVFRPRDRDEAYEELVDLGIVERSRLPFADQLQQRGRAVGFHFPDGREGVAAEERGFLVSRLWPAAASDPPSGTAAGSSATPISREDAIDVVVRAHLLRRGPSGVQELGLALGLPAEDVAAAFVRLEASGVALRGRFDPALDDEQACDRALLARIHRGTLEKLRRGVEPVEAESYLRFLVRWHGLHRETRTAGPAAVRAAIRRLAAYPAPFSVLESRLLAPRVEGYKARWLDELGLRGEVLWRRARRTAVEGPVSASRSILVAFAIRGESSGLEPPGPVEGAREHLRGPAQSVIEVLERRGASFAADLAREAKLLPAELVEGLREGVAAGFVAADGFAPLRRLLASPERGGRDRFGRRRREVGEVLPGRWELVRAERLDDEALAMACVRRLLDRYGIVFRELVLTEGLPVAYPTLQRALRTLELRGELRGGRFVRGGHGEQYALPTVVAALRAERERPPESFEILLDAADPLLVAAAAVGALSSPATAPVRLRDGLVVPGEMPSVPEGRPATYPGTP